MYAGQNFAVPSALFIFMKNLLLSGQLGGSAEEIITKSLILCALSFTLSYVLIPLCRALAEVMGAQDLPDGVRRINTERMPRLGGLGFFVAFSAVILIGGMLGDSTVNALIIGGGIIVAAGVSDDVFSLTPGVKLALQLAAAFVALTFIEIPDRFSFFGLVSLSLTGILGAAFAMGRIVFSVNAVGDIKLTGSVTGSYNGNGYELNKNGSGYIRHGNYGIYF